MAETPEDRDRVYRLRYLCYRRDEAIDARDDERFQDRYDSMPNHFSFLARAANDEPVGTVRISVVRPEAGWEIAPSHSVFGDVPAFQQIARGSFVEASRLCLPQQARRDSLLRVISYMAALADFYEVEWLVACPRVEHSHTYEKLFGFRRCAEPRQYYGVKFSTTLLAVPRLQLRQYACASKHMDTARNQALAHLESGSALLPLLAGPRSHAEEHVVSR
ncbi:MAG TPA: GNAT family N-acyltransferase [Candidatus Sulfopaludibacter sp.]|nr:GNAT family N-acyltransferase [Candidatus Sulfopaludibacter sp.]